MSRFVRFLHALFGNADTGAPRAPTVEALEQRILYSADPIGLYATGAFSAEVRLMEPEPAAVQTVRELVVIDAAVDDAEALTQALTTARPAGTQFEFVRLDASRDGVEQISALLAARDGLSAMHIISHGQAGALQLGSTRLDAAALEARGTELTAWRDALTDRADLLLYGCDVAAGPGGSAFIARLAELTGADVAASTDATGSAVRGGDWVLEATTGPIEAQLGALASQLETSWSGLLPYTASGSETRANTTTNNNQQTTVLSGSQIASSASGSFVAVWEDTITDYVYARLYNANGTPATAEFQVNTDVSGALNKDQATVAMDSAGNFVIAWESQSQDGSGYGIYAQRYNASGVAQGSEFRVNTTTANAQERPAIAMNSAGFVITWTSASQDGSGDGVYAQRYNAAGVAQGSEFRANTTTSVDQNGSDIGMDAAGNFVIAWSSATGDGSGTGVYAQRYNAAGSAQGSEFRINVTTAGNQTLGSVAMNAAGSFAVAWTSASQDGSLDGVYARLYDSGGTALSSEFQLNSTTASNQRDPSVALDATGRLLATWSSYGQDAAATWGIYLRQFSATGTALTSETRVNTTTANDQEFGSVTWNGTQAVVSWSGNGPGDTDGVYFQRYSAPTPGFTVTPTSGLLTTEAGGTAQFSVVLTQAPTANVTIPVSSSDTTEGTVSTALLTFTTANWNTPQPVTVTGVNDALADGFHAYTVVLGAATSTDADYSGLNAADVQLANSDDDIGYGLITVDTTSDTTDGDTSSLAALAANRGADGVISLREAITAANNSANGSAADRIHFNIAGTGAHTITPAAALPAITGALVLDASTDDSFAANASRPAVILDGNGGAYDGLVLTAGAGGSTIRGFVIRDFGTLSTHDGIEIQAGSNGNTIAGNYIGRLGSTGVDSGAADANTGSGIAVAGAGNTIGGTAALDGNVIAGNGDNGILVSGAAATGNTVLGNTVGLNAAQSAALGNTNQGVWIGSGATYNTVGGTAAGAANVIAGNTFAGVELNGAGTSNNTVLGNTIGTNAAGAAGLGNGNGVNIKVGASNNLIGGTAAGAGNLIANSTTGNGVAVQTTSTGNAVLGNRIVLNSLLGIDLGWDGITANDANDTDTGPNGLQNAPVLTSASVTASGTTLNGTFNTTASTSFRIEFYASSPAVADATNGEGERYLGFVNLTTNGAGNATGTFALPGVWVNAGDRVTATATVDLGGGNYGSTSEFGPNVTATASGVIVVDTTSDTYDSGVASGSVTIATLNADRGTDGRISLREAIHAANNTANGGTPDRIVFAIDGTGAHTITPLTTLPSITSAVVIDASTDDSFAANANRPAIVLDGNNGAGTGLTLASGAGGSTIRGLVIRDFASDGIAILSGADGNTIAGNYIGRFDTTGADAGAGEGNTSTGIYLQSANNVIGGTAVADRNLFGGNGLAGVGVYNATATGNQVIGNWIGLAADGSTVIANGTSGVRVLNGASSTTIGGSTAAHGNVISGNTVDGVQIGGGSNNVVRGNTIGTDVTGTLDRGNSGDGVNVGGTVTGSQILDNLVSGNDANGIDLGDSGAVTGTVVQGNRIGTQADGSSALGNGSHGIRLGSGGTASSSTLGGTGVGQGNTIAFNAGDGIYVASGTAVTVLGNTIHSNAALGIDLGTDGVTANDAGDADSGANNLQNFPLLGLAQTNSSSQVVINGTLNSNANSYYRIEFYANTSGDGTGNGEGRTFIGFVNVATNAAGNVAFEVPLAANVAVGSVISATATRSVAGYASFSDTSEFAANITATAAAVLPVNTVPGAQATNEDTALVFSSGNGNAISIADADAGGAGNQITISVTNGTLTLSGTAGLTFIAGDGTADALMTLHGTAAAINAALNGLTYLPTADYTGGATLTLTTTDHTLQALNVDTGLIGRHAFENGGALGTDTSPAAGYNGTVSGATAVVDGTRGNVISLAGAGTVQTTGHYGNPANVTVAAWVNLTAADTSGAEVISLGDSVALRLDNVGSPQGLMGFVYTGGSWSSVSFNTVLAGTGWPPRGLHLQ